MAIDVQNRGLRNQFLIEPIVLERCSGQIVVTGDDNLVVIEGKCASDNLRVTLGSQCVFHAAQGAILGAIEVYAARKGRIEIGLRAQFTWHTRILLHEPGEIKIGQGCLIAGGTLLTLSDMHSIIDVETRKRINPARSITIEENVWIAENVCVLKGSLVGKGSIVGFGAVVTGTLPPNCMAVGVPAKVVRKGVTWMFELLHDDCTWVA